MLFRFVNKSINKNGYSYINKRPVDILNLHKQTSYIKLRVNWNDTMTAFRLEEIKKLNFGFVNNRYFH